MGLPEIIIKFKGLAVSAIARSARGIVAVLLIDDTEGGKELNVYNSITDIDFENWTETNYGYLKLIFEGSPVSVIALRQKTADKNINKALTKFKDLIWNYFCFPGIGADDKTVVSAWIKEMREEKHKTFKAVLPEITADHEGIINFTTDNVQSTVTGKTHTAEEYCARIAGMLAGLSLARSATYFVLSDVVSADVPEEPDEHIDDGELIIVYDGKQYKIGRGVNSLTSFTTEKPEDIRKIKIVEGMDLLQDDIRNTFQDSYIGKVINDYDNKQMFVASINSYFKELQGDVLDRSYTNVASVDAEAQKTYLEGRGQDTSKLSATELLTANTGSKVFLTAQVKFVDAMEDLQLTVNM